ncbi:hypothetical protein [Streptacidiphilus carbonis]|uniref:hypothetical protein n=1 Tax=Streptacidiphilus carbonis TaxID=105422 RepID=UPI000A643794|nr:hypothetical protein [Streptacidiphilus carbonis]
MSNKTVAKTDTATTVGTGSKAKQLKGFKHTKPGILFGIGGSLFGAVGVAKDLRKAREEGDTLKLVNAAVAALALVTSTALLVRELRRLGDDDILLG